MKRIILIITLACMSFLSTNARESAINPLPSIDGTYMNEVLQQHALVTSSVMDKDFLMTNFLIENQKKFNTIDLMSIKEHLDKMSDKQLFMLNSMDFKDPTVALILSVIVGGLGVDRFYIGDTGLGVLTLITAGGLGVWWLVDIFVINGKTKKNNAKDFQNVVILQESLAK